MIKQKGSKVKAAMWWLLSIIWLVIIFVFAGQSAQDSSNLSGSIADMILRRFPVIDINPDFFEHVLRKLAHFSIFLVQGFLIRMALFETKPRGFANSVIALILCVPLAVLNELYEMFAPGRACTVIDMVIDYGGSLIGVALGALMAWIIESSRIRKAYKALTRTA